MLSSLRKGLLGLALGSVLVAGAGISPLEQAVADTSATRRIRSKADSLWRSGRKNKAIKQYMRLSRVEDILGDSVKYVQYNPRTKTTTFDRLVYQTDLKVRKPVLVLFYGPRERDPANFGAVQRQAIVFKDLMRRYRRKVKFVAYNGGNERIKPWSLSVRTRMMDFKAAGMKAGPSIGMYNYFDLTKGETPRKRDRTITQIDMWKGGPDAPKYIVPAITEASNYWINFNALGKYARRAKYTYKYDNEWKIKRVDF